MAASKRWRLSPLEYKIDFVIVPILFSVAIWWSTISLPQMVVGFLAWSVSEYATHRFLFHKHFRKDHWAHHIDPTAYIGISGIQIGIAYAALLILACWLGLESIYAGFMLGYFWYLVVHYAIHRSDYQRWKIFYGLTRNHELHHQRGRETNFGVTSPMWDFVFFTYSRPEPSDSAG
ncbi:MAG: fatty acid hydroxylase family protein [Alcaligenaceae bacterium]|nr:MAG: fatty acid hydroxylase family protein [Alcaligenaceae bacterium]